MDKTIHGLTRIGIAAATRRVLREIGEDPDREGLLKTPDRYAEALLFFTKGYSESVEQVVNDAIFTIDTQELVFVRDVSIFSMCEHHMVPFTGKVSFGLVHSLRHPFQPAALMLSTRHILID